MGKKIKFRKKINTLGLKGTCVWSNMVFKPQGDFQLAPFPQATCQMLADLLIHLIRTGLYWEAHAVPKLQLRHANVCNSLGLALKFSGDSTGRGCATTV